jgi:hypothetical protein
MEERGRGTRAETRAYKRGGGRVEAERENLVEEEAGRFWNLRGAHGLVSDGFCLFSLRCGLRAEPRPEDRAVIPLFTVQLRSNDGQSSLSARSAGPRSRRL